MLIFGHQLTARSLQMDFKEHAIVIMEFSDCSPKTKYTSLLIYTLGVFQEQILFIV